MTEILWHGRGGQGAFTAARLLGDAYSLKDNAYALAFPSFGPERRGAPIRAFTKLDQKPIGNRSEITKSNYSIFLDDTLFNAKSFRELKQNGKILLNTKKKFDDPRVITLDGDSIAAQWQPTPVFLPGESQGQRSLVAAVYGVSQSRTRLKRLSSSSSRVTELN